LLRESLAGLSASLEDKKPGGLPPVIEESNKVAADWKCSDAAVLITTSAAGA
jgi:hypothetical protein